MVIAMVIAASRGTGTQQYIQRDGVRKAMRIADPHRVCKRLPGLVLDGRGRLVSGVRMNNNTELLYEIYFYIIQKKSHRTTGPHSDLRPDS